MLIIDLAHRLARIRCLENVQPFALQLSKDDTQCFADEDVIVDDEDLHGACFERLSPCHHT